MLTGTDDCGGTFTDATGVLASPNYPANYRNRDACAYFVKVRKAAQIVFYFSDIETEVFKDVIEFGRGDEVDIRNGVVDSWEGNLTTDNQLPGPFSVATTDGNVWFYWSTDRNIPQKGWELRYAAGEFWVVSCFVACLHRPLYAISANDKCDTIK